ncbi:MAG: hypothetical protein QM767_29690 [Anaeromyxobacter sp.]
MDPASQQDLSRFVREHHVHCEVEPETVEAGGRREVVAHDLRLFATHGEAGLRAPGCQRCAALERELRAFAEQAVRAGAEDVTEFLPAATRALHASTEVPGADEVEVRVRVRCASPEHRQAESDPCLEAVERRLEALGLPRR